MKNLTVKSPEIIDKSQYSSILQSEISGHKVYANVFGVKIPQKLKTIDFADLKKEGEKLLLDLNTLLSPSISNELVKMQIRMQACSGLGEGLYQKLQKLNNKYRNHKITLEFLSEKKTSYEELDFMGHRDLFSKLVKSNTYKGTEKISAEYSLKSITKTFHKIILDRNRYTHGELVYSPRFNSFVIIYKDNAEEVYAKICTENLISYEESCSHLDEIISKLSLHSDNLI